MATADTQEKGSAMKSRFVVRGNGFTDEEWEQIEGNYEPGTPVLTSAEDEWVRAALWSRATATSMRGDWNTRWRKRLG